MLPERRGQHQEDLYPLEAFDLPNLEIGEYEKNYEF